MSQLITLFALLFFWGCEDKVSDGGQVQDRVEEPPVFTQPAKPCDINTPLPPSNLVIKAEGSATTSAAIEFSAPAQECGIDHIQFAIGTSPGEDDVRSFHSIGLQNSYTEENLVLDYSKQYYITLKSVGKNGKVSTTISTDSWQIFDPRTLTDLVVWLDSSDSSALEDSAGNHPGSAGFNGEINLWHDRSGSPAAHDFSANSGAPNWDVTERALMFNGSNDMMFTADHDDINTSIIGQRTLAVRFRSADEVLSRQVIYEEGGILRGINFYIEDGKFHCGFWNNIDDGDQRQRFTRVSEEINPNTRYTAIMVYDYSNFNGRRGPKGEIECYIDAQSIGTTQTTSRLHAHSGDIGLGSMNNGSYFSDGSVWGGGYHFKGHIYELLMYNTAHSSTSIDRLHQNLAAKW